VLKVSYDASQKDKRELLSDWVAIMRQLRALGVVRTNNNPIGDIAEAIVCDHYGGERGSFSQKGWDVKTPDGELIQVKSRRKTPDSKPALLSPISNDEYDSLVVVIFNEDFQVTEGLRATRALVEERFNLDSKNQRRVRLGKLRPIPRSKRSISPRSRGEGFALRDSEGARLRRGSWSSAGIRTPGSPLTGTRVNTGSLG
jgi:hypothetical protein